MEECELCGRETKDVYVLDVENVEIRACAKCAKGKKVIRQELETAKAKSKPMQTRPVREEEMPLVENYGDRIRQARENMKLPLKVLAEKINEKEHYLTRVEEQKTEPNNTLIKKLEKELKIKLTASEAIGESAVFKAKRSEGATLGEFAG